jgi:hypothetical protein
VPASNAPQIVIHHQRGTYTFDVSADGIVQCESQDDADLLIAFIPDASEVQPKAKSKTTSEENR